jgi:hypothetical protein
MFEWSNVAGQLLDSFVSPVIEVWLTGGGNSSGLVGWMELDASRNRFSMFVSQGACVLAGVRNTRMTDSQDTATIDANPHPLGIASDGYLFTLSSPEDFHLLWALAAAAAAVAGWYWNRGQRMQI